MSKISYGIIVVLILAALIPFAFVARSRASKSENPAIHLVFDMDDQAKKKTQSPSEMFADGRSMRPQVDGTVAREDLSLPGETLNDPENPHTIQADIAITDPSAWAALTLGRNRSAGMTDEQFNNAKPINITDTKATDDDIAKDTFYVHSIPSQIHVNADFIHRGQERFNIYCSPCHGQSGAGDGTVYRHAKILQESGNDPGTSMIQPQNLYEPKIRSRPDGNIFNTITNGVRTMPPYDKQISIVDRWAIIAYVRALEKSQNETNVALPTATAPAPTPKP